MTLIWLIVWLVFDNVGDKEPLLFDPVNVWVWTLILAIALDLGRQHAPVGKPKAGDLLRVRQALSQLS